MRVRNLQTGQYVDKVESIVLDHLGDGLPIMFVAQGKQWALGPAFELEVEGVVQPRLSGQLALFEGKPTEGECPQ